MKLLMDSDCLIKLTRSSLKEIVCGSFDVEIPLLVKKEVIDNASGQPDAVQIQTNLVNQLLKIRKQEGSTSKGEDAVFSTFKAGQYDAICSDDKRFIRRLRLFHVPYLTPAVLIAVLLKESKLTIVQALEKLEALSPMVSEEEYWTVKATLDQWRKK